MYSRPIKLLGLGAKTAKVILLQWQALFHCSVTREAISRGFLTRWLQELL